MFCNLHVLCSPDLTRQQTEGSITLLWENGATKYLVQGSTVILFKPYRDVTLNHEYYKAISIYCWKIKERAFKQVLHWTKYQFHITCVSSTNDYVALTWLPYNPAALEEAMQKQQMHQYHRDLLARFQREITDAKLRSEAELRQWQANQQLERQRRECAEQY